MKRRIPKVFDVLDHYFRLMDEAPVGGDSVFPNHKEKEKHESVLMYAFRKYRATSYHLENVKRFLAQDSLGTDFSNVLDGELLPRGATALISVHRTADHFIYELAAFFEAAKSSLDFLATACSTYLRGITTDSISTLVRCVEQKAKGGPIIDVVKQHLSWLKQLRDYRHHLVHRMVITASTAHEVQKRGRLVKRIKGPVVVPEETPPYFPDTRRSRMMEDEPRGLDYKWFEGKIEHPDGTEEIVDFSTEYTPSKGYTEISAFMTLQLHTLERFFSDTIAALEKLNFKKL
jgi:hypothetical protein